ILIDWINLRLLSCHKHQKRTSKMKCCGAESQNFWSSLPKSCCETLIADTCTVVNSYKRGCISVTREFVMDYSNIIAYVVIGVAGVEYAFFLFCLIVLQVVIACLIFVYQDDFRKGFEKGIRELFDNSAANAEAIDTIQRTIGGIAFVAIGGIILAKAGDINTAFKDTNAYSVPIALIVLGSIIFIIAFFGCCGAVRESQCMTMTMGLGCGSSLIKIVLFIFNLLCV
uniref:CSON005313 protein n=1 Tax=Culicoides sonorensis TaxID=179676 RepID=A0A336K9P6_CULSO